MRLHALSPRDPTDAPNEVAKRAGASPRTLAACVVVICLVLLGLDLWRTWQARQIQLAANQVETANLAQSLALHAHDLLRVTDALLLDMRSDLEAGPAPATTHPPIATRQGASVPMLRGLSAFDAQGDRVSAAGSSWAATTTARRSEIADLAIFQRHRAQPDRGLHIGRPLRSMVDGTWIITLSRRVDGPYGRFNGVVVATIPTEALAAIYRSFVLGTDGMIGLSRSDGILLARYPETPAIGADLGERPVYRTLLKQSPHGPWATRSVIDDVEHRGSYHRVEGYDLVITVAHGHDEVLALWRADALFHLVVTLCTAGIIAVLGIRFARQLELQDAAEREVHQRESRYRLLADNCTDLIIQLGPDLRHIWVSPASERLLFTPPQALLGDHLKAIAHPDDWPMLLANLASIATHGHAPPVGYRARRRDGTTLWVEAAGRRLDGGQGFVLVMRDITQRREAEAQLYQAQRMEAVGQLTAGVAHDFNNLLQAQLGALELLIDEVQDRPRALDFAAMALAASESGARLTHSLLAFSRQQVLEPRAIEVPALLAQLTRILSRTLGPRIALQLDVEPDLPPVFADAAQLEAALLNLSINARDAMLEGGRLGIEARCAEATSDAPDGLAPGRHIRLTVSDDGMGMSPETLAQACEPFFTTKGVGKGSGLGLSMVQGFARQSGGALRVRSTPGLGTRVELWLPIAAAGAPEPLRSKPTFQGAGRILLVDDVPDLLAVMSEVLRTTGFTVVPARSGEAAAALLRQDLELDIIVTDFAMPGIDGGALVRQARQLRPGLPAIIVTGYAEADGLATVPSDVVVLRKPIGADDLARCIRDVLDATADAALSPA